MKDTAIRTTAAMQEKTARLLLGIAVPGVAALVGYGPYLAAWSDLPDPLAAHFNSSGVPDGAMSPLAFLGVNSILFVLGLGLCVAVASIGKPIGGITGLGMAALGGFFCAFSAGILLITVVAQRGLSSWTEASFSVVSLVLVVLFGLVMAAAAARLAGVLPAMLPTSPGAAIPVMDLGVGEQAVWTGTLRSALLATLGVASLVFGAFMALATSRWLVVAVVVMAALAILALSALTVRADRRGLHVKYGLLPWPRTHIAIDEIDQASVIDVRPKQWGGWGYRGSLKVMKQAAVVLRAGPGIRLDLRNGNVFVVTIDNPETAVALLNAQVERARVSI